MKKVLITGGSGMIGKYLSEKLVEKNYTVCWLSQNKKITHEKTKIYFWDIQSKTIDLQAFENTQYVVHLAGANIAQKRWTNEFKREILNSRIESTDLLIRTIIDNKLPIKKLVGASAVGYYGMKNDEKIYTEDDNPGDDFLAHVCALWEEAYRPLVVHHIPTAILRIGLVLSHTGGIYTKLKPLFQIGLGSALGNGKQYMPWIHIDDLCNMIIFLLENENIQGIFNAVSDEYISNYKFSKKMAESFHAPFFLPNIPEFILKMIFGEQYQLLVTGLKTSNEKIKRAGFQFRFSTLEDALHDLKEKLNT
ncbi:MAG: TIGR01777 family oxidoreductase [Bacteroidia bacterium]|nr:TIGR01777 family oxidoreductase [Bacteroidia bacterium]